MTRPFSVSGLTSIFPTSPLTSALAFAPVGDVKRFLLLPTISARPAVVATPPVASRSAFAVLLHGHRLRTSIDFYGWYANVPVFSWKATGAAPKRHFSSIRQGSRRYLLCADVWLGRLLHEDEIRSVEGGRMEAGCSDSAQAVWTNSPPKSPFHNCWATSTKAAPKMAKSTTTRRPMARATTQNCIV